MAKSCKKGYYYCYTSKKCKKIPKGWHLMSSTGRIMKDSEHKEEEETKKNGNGANGNGSGNGDSSGSSDGGGVSEGWSAKYKRSIDCGNPKGFSQRAHCQGRKKVNEAKGYEKDHEVSMAQSQLKKSEKNIAILRKKLGKKERNIPAWVQAKITDTEHNTDAAAGYMDEARKSGDYSLRDWFAKSRASDGTPGWVQLGGKYAGKPCAKQPGQKTKPKCGSSKMKADLSDKEEEYAFRSKNRKDKNPNRKGSPINVATEKKKKLKDSYSNWRQELEDLHEIPALVAVPLAVGGVALAGRAIGGALNKFVDSQKKGQHRIKASQGNPVAGLNASRRRIENQSFELEGDLVEEGKKDACYYKVKSRYSVWPSAYASGALVKCREVGAKNWGNKTKKESYEFSNWRDDFQALEFETINIIEAEPLKKVNEDWQKENRKDNTDGMSPEAVKAYRRENPESKLQTAVTEKNPKGKRKKRRKSFCDRSDGQRKMHNIDCSKTPDKAICKARKRWRC